MRELAKGYEPGAIEARWAEKWVAEKLFAVATPPPGSAEAKRVFTLLLPPPNITGRLHMGHMLNQTEMDIIIRWRRMRGERVLWLPGTDHASIATQMMVERQLASEGMKRTDLGREKFLERVWQWREHYGGEIQRQMKRLGATVDWSREYFTMDEGLSAAVCEVFVRLYEEGLIYRGRYIVNWCPSCLTAISDLEVVREEVPGKLYEICYPVSGSREFITVATTRPETMLGDTAVAVNAADPRHRHLHGKKVLLPLAPEERTDLAGKKVGRELPVIVDELANPEFGTGAVKVTPAHDANDFEAGERHQLPQVEVMDAGARMNQNTGKFAGLDRVAARERILEELKAQGLLAGVKEHTVALGKCQRCGTVIEPRLSLQWFVAVNKQAVNKSNLSLARLAMHAVEGETPAIRFTPENYRQIYLNWMENIHDWCISRQLWWGQRIPAWHCRNQACAHITVARAAPAACEKCGGAELEQDPDVLDTWFSSALLPFTIFGWPERTREQEVFYPTSLLITGFDILFLWVSRMIMMGCWFNYDFARAGDPAALAAAVPFREVYIHGLVRDAERQKMSKTKGNVVDPIAVTEKYGTDAVRFTLASMASPGTDIAFNPARCAGYRAFANKIWNAARFLFMNLERAEAAGVRLRQLLSGPQANSAPEFKPERLEDRWIRSRFARVTGQVNADLTSYRFDEAAGSVYQFFWGDFCDWYLEMVKLRLMAGAEARGEEKDAGRTALANLVIMFERSLRLLAPFMPFVTEELWHALHDGKPPRASVALAAYPQEEAHASDAEADNDMAGLQEFITTVRELRSTAGVPPREPVAVNLRTLDGTRRVLRENDEVVRRLANVSAVNHDSGFQSAGKRWTRSTPHFDVEMIYEKKIDTTAERERLKKELEKMERERASAAAQLGNNRFLEKAPAQVVTGLRKRKAELDLLTAKTQQALAELQ